MRLGKFMSKKIWKAKPKITMAPDSNNRRISMTMSNEMWDALDLLRDPSISVQECVRQIVATYLGFKR